MEKQSSRPDLSDEAAIATTTSRALRNAAWAVLVVSVLSSTFLYALDNTILANIRPAIIYDLGNVDKLAWVSVAYALGETSMNPLWGKLYGQFDNKVLFCLSVVIFDVGSALCGAAPSIDALIAGRVIAGMGGSGIYIGTLNIFSVMTEVNERALYLSFVGIAWCIGTILGPIIGGAFSDSSAIWRWSFYINLCISAVAAPVYIWFLPSNPSKMPRFQLQRLRQIDFIGVILFVAAAVTLIMAISFGGQIYSWSSGQVISLLVLTFVLWICFGLQQSYTILTTPQNRLFPVYFCRQKEMCLLFAETAVGISLVVVPIYFIPLFFQFVDGVNALDAGVKTLPFIFSTVVGCLVNGALFEKFSFYLPWFTVGASLSLVGAGFLTTMTQTIHQNLLFGFSVLIGVGSGSFAQAGYAVGQAIQPPERHSDVTAFLSCAQMTGVALSIGIGTSIFVNEATQDIAQILPDATPEDVQTTITGLGSQFLLSLDASLRLRVLDAVVAAIRDAFIMVACAAGLAILLSLSMQRKRLFSPSAGDDARAADSQKGHRTETISESVE